MPMFLFLKGTDSFYVVASLDAVSYVRYSGVTEDGETFMSVNGLRSSCLARGTRVLEVRKCIFMSGT